MKDKVFMYEPPEIARNIPNNALPEWYIGASKLCLLPDLKFGDGPKHGPSAADNDAKQSEDPKVQQENAMKHTNIGAGSGCAGSVLTLSFHVKQANVIKLYLYYSGQCIRFMAEDVKVVLPLLFNLDYGDNRKWIEGKEVDGYIEETSHGAPKGARYS